LLIVLVPSPRVVPGLLSWPAREALRSASSVLAPPGHPQLPAPDDAGIAYRVVDEPDVSRSTRTKLWYGCAIRVPTRWSRQALSCWTVRPTCPMRTWSTSLPPWTGCASNVPWDARQTHASLALHLLEEPYEALEALECGDEQAFREELGDVLLQVVFHTRVAAECDDGTGFTIDDVAEGIVGKLVRRHPHVVGDVTVSGADEVKRNWDEIKREEKRTLAEQHGRVGAGQDAPFVLDGVPFGQPALALAAQLQRRATRAGLSDELGRLDGDEDIGGGPFRLVAKTREEERDPEMELRAAVRRWEQSAESC
jgi:XTP/dITP diphosphohydrolase